MKRASLTVILALGIGLTAIAVPEKNRSQSKPKGPLVFTATIGKTPIFDRLTYPARLIPKINATVLSETDGVVEKIEAPLGTAVHRNQAIMSLKHTDPVYRYAPYEVPAPVTGVVSSVEVTVGSRVIQGAKLATIIDPNKLNIQIEVPISDMGAIHRGLTGELKLTAEESAYPASVIGLSPFVDPATGTATAELALTHKGKTNPKLPPGMVGMVTFKANQHDGLEVPDSAIVYRGQDAFLRVVENGKAKYQQVTLGQTRSGDVEILKGLRAGQSVIVRASSYIGNGEEVTAQPIEASKS